LIVGGLLLACLLAAAPAGAKPRPAPKSFYGVVSQAGSFSTSDVSRLSRGGVGTVRFLLAWRGVERAPGNYRWGPLDAKIDAIRKAGATPLPVLFGLPPWFGNSRTPPIRTDQMKFAWQRFLDRVVTRYGPGGTMAALDPDYEPITAWQLWNEPNLPSFWGESAPEPRDYVTLVRLSALAIHDVDPEAELIAAGLSPAPNGMPPVDYMDAVYDYYDELGIDPDFDHISLNPYARSVKDSKRQVRRFSRAARRATGSRPRLLIAEIGWGSGGPKRHPATTTKKRQAKRVSRAFRMFERKRRRWRISSVHWYAWRDLPPSADGCPFCAHVGLFDSDGRAKPAWKTFRRTTRRGR